LIEIIVKNPIQLMSIPIASRLIKNIVGVGQRNKKEIVE